MLIRFDKKLSSVLTTSLCNLIFYLVFIYRKTGNNKQSHRTDSMVVSTCTVVATFITVRSYFDACGSSVWSPKRHNLGDFGIVILFAFSICSMTFSQNGLTNLHSQSACTNVPISVWHFQHKLLAKIPIRRHLFEASTQFEFQSSFGSSVSGQPLQSLPTQTKLKAE